MLPSVTIKSNIIKIMTVRRINKVNFKAAFPSKKYDTPVKKTKYYGYEGIINILEKSLRPAKTARVARFFNIIQ